MDINDKFADQAAAADTAELAAELADDDSEVKMAIAMLPLDNTPEPKVEPKAEPDTTGAKPKAKRKSKDEPDTTGAKPKAKRKLGLRHACDVCDKKYDRAERLSAHLFNKHGTTSTQLTTGLSTGQPTAVAHLHQQHQEFVCPLDMSVYYDEQVDEAEVPLAEEKPLAEDPLAEQ